MKPPNLRIATDERACGSCRHFYVTLPGRPHDGGECGHHTEQSWRPEVVRSDFACDSHVSPDGTVPDTGPAQIDANVEPGGGPV